MGTFLTGLVLGLIGMLYMDDRAAVRASQEQDFATESQAREFAQQEKLQRQQMEYNSFPNQVNMMKSAGLNPALMYGSSAGSVSAGTAPSVAHADMPNFNMSTYDPNFLLGSMDKSLNAALSVLTAKSNIANTEAQTYNLLNEVGWRNKKMPHDIRFVDSQTGKTQTETLKDFFEAMITKNNFQYNDLKNQFDILGMQYGIQKTSAETKKLFSEAELNQWRQKLTQVEINNAAWTLSKEQDLWNNVRQDVINSYKLENLGKYYQAQKTFNEAVQEASKASIWQRSGFQPNTFGCIVDKLNMTGELLFGPKNRDRGDNVNPNYISRFKNSVIKRFQNDVKNVHNFYNMMRYFNNGGKPGTLDIW